MSRLSVVDKRQIAPHSNGTVVDSQGKRREVAFSNVSLQTWMPQNAYVALLMAVLAVPVFFPTHAVLKRSFGRAVAAR